MTICNLEKSQILSSSFSLPRETPLLSNLHKFSILHHLCPFQAWELCGIVVENHLLKVTTLFLFILVG